MKKFIFIAILALMILSVAIFCDDLTEPFSDVYDGATITFEDGLIWTAESIGDNNFQDDEAECELSVEKFEGSRQLKIRVIGKNEKGDYKVPKIRFDVDKLIGTQNVSKIKSVSLDVTAAANGTFTADNGDEILVPGNCMGEINANTGENCAVWTKLAGFNFAEWEKTSVKRHITGKILLDESRYIDGETGCTLVLMRWSIPNSADIYIDNITFFDDEGNPLPLVYNPAETD